MEHELNKGKSQGKDMSDGDKKTKVGLWLLWTVCPVFSFPFPGLS